MLRVENFFAGYKELRILFDINAVVEKGKVTTIAGPNGSGKSTFLKSVFGLVTIQSGRVLYKSKDITTNSTTQEDHDRYSLPSTGREHLY